MVTLNRTIIDIADHNSTLFHFNQGKGRQGEQCLLAPAEEYQSLYRSIAANRAAERPCFGADDSWRLRPIYWNASAASQGSDTGARESEAEGAGPRTATEPRPTSSWTTSYWCRHFGNGAIETFPDRAWERIVPIEARPPVRRRLTVSHPKGVQVQVRPILRVLLYPFGWSTWISLLVLGDHTLENLARLVDQCLKGANYYFDRTPSKLTLAELRQEIGNDVRRHFFGDDPHFESPIDVRTVATVLEKFGGAPALRALGENDERSLRRLVSAGQGASSKNLEFLVQPLRRKDPATTGNIDYALLENGNVFLWADHRLKRGSPWNRKHLREYHNNTFFSLVHAWQLCHFLQRAANAPRGVKKKKDGPLVQLVKVAIEQLDQPGSSKRYYRNRCLLSFLEGAEVRSAVEKAKENFQSVIPARAHA